MEPGIIAAIIGGVAVAVAGLFLWLGNKQSHGSIIAIKSKPANGKKNLPSKENWLTQFTGNNNNGTKRKLPIKTNPANNQTKPANNQTNPANNQTNPANKQTNPANNQTNPANKQHNVFVPRIGTMYVPWVPIWNRDNGQVKLRVH